MKITVDSVKHKDKRKNIPTEELRDFVAEDENAPKTMLYPRDPSLDPQLVWKGKDEQDQKDLAVLVVPIYIQEKIHPQAIINALPRIDHSGGQLDLFADFNGLPEEFSDRVDFYHHEGNWSNRMILGDSLLVMTSLAEKEGLKGKVQTIYIDPPYGIKFGSNWQVSTRRRDVKDGKATDVTRQPEQIRAFRDTWKLGIHSYLAYLRDRLVVARDLLSETGSAFVQIGAENAHLARCLIDEVLGAENFVSQIAFGKTSGATDETLPSVCDYLLWYAKSKEQVKFRRLFLLKGFEGTLPSVYRRIQLADGQRRAATADELEGKLLPGARIYSLGDLTSSRVREARTGYYPISFAGREYLPGAREWSTHRVGIERLRLADRLESTEDRLGYIRFLDDFPAITESGRSKDTIRLAAAISHVG